jgi:oligopeptide/dipeptide ABC transporter ATP-binding protein
VCAGPRHPYTEALMSAVPVPNPRVERTRERIVLQGDIPSPLNPPAGCRFHTRCPFVMDICREVDPPPHPRSDGGWAACHLHTTGPVLAGRPVRELTLQDQGAALTSTAARSDSQSST